MHLELTTVQDEQIKNVEQTKLNAKKRRGVAPFIRNFSTYVNRVEVQLVGADDMEVRGNVDAAYERIVQAMFDCLKQMAKMEGEQGEDKGQLNYHVILIGEQKCEYVNTRKLKDNCDREHAAFYC